MGTRATIILLPEGSLEFYSIYTHWDGYPSHHGPILLENYTTNEKVWALIQLGGLSELHATADACIAYHRDRGEELHTQVGPDLTEHADQEYAYLFRNGAWHYSDNNGKVWNPLSEYAIVESGN